MKTKFFSGIAIVAIAVTVAFNVTLSNQKQDAASKLALANVEVLAEAEPSCNMKEKTLTGSGLYVTEVNGSASGSVSIGMRFNSNWSAEIQASIRTENKDEYKIECYSGGTACCTSLDWHQCASGGCPKAGTKG